MQWSQFRKTFDATLEAFLQEKCKEREAHLYDNTLQQIMTYIHPFSHDGKRIRPYNFYLRYHACGGTDSETALNQSISLELIQLFALIHDDIVDKGTLRHGIPTYHLHCADLYNSEAIGIGQAMLMWDLVYTRALEHFTSYDLAPAVKHQLRLLLKEVLLGEIIDVHMSHTPIVTNPQLIPFKDKLKSGYYTFKRPMLLWATMANASPETCATIDKIGEDLWLAFQMRDDLMDILDPQSNKTSFSDHQEGNQTAILLYALEHATSNQKAFLLQTRGQELTDTDREELKTIFEETGAIEFVKDQVKMLLDNASAKIISLFPDFENNIYVQNILEIVKFLYVE